MNFGIQQSTKTTTAIYTNTNTTLTSTAIETFENFTGEVSTERKGSSSSTEGQSSSNSCSSSNQKIENSVSAKEFSKSFTTPQNCFEVLTSIQNRTVPDNLGSTTSAVNLLSSSSSVSLSPTSSNAASFISADDDTQSMRLVASEDLRKEFNPTISVNSDCNETTVKSTLSSVLSSTDSTLHVLKSDNVTSKVVTSEHTESSKYLSESVVSNITLTDKSELNYKVHDLICSDSKIAINSENTLRCDEDSISKSSENSGDLIRSFYGPDCVDKLKNVTRLSERAKKKSWYNVLYPNYKSRSLEFKKLFKEVPNDERLIVDYSCALYRDLLIQGRLYISQNYVCFHANILGWETCLIVKWKDVTSITKEKTALVIPNAILICTPKEKFFFSSFTTRDKTFLILFRVWQNTLMNRPMPAQEIWQLVHSYYGEELGLTTDDEDYIDPSLEDRDESISNLEFLSVTDVSKALSINEDRVDTSTSNIYQLVDSGSANCASNISGNNSVSSCDKLKAMKSHAKELTLISAKPEDGSASNSQIQTATTSGSATGGTVGAVSNSSSVSKDAKHGSTTYDSKRKVSKNNRQRDENTNKNSETLPTDISDSSDSEENNIPFVATAECNSPHEGRQLVHTILPINIETLFNLLFSKSKFMLDFHAMRKSTDLVFGEWITNESGQKTRTFNVTVQLAASVGPKTSKVTEFQVMRDCSKPGELYSIDINNVNAGIPYADSFSVLVHYCLVKTVDDHTMLSVHAQIKYKKSIWGVVKGFIEKNTWAGLDDFYTSLLHSLQSETCIPPAKGKGRRPRRGTAAQIRPLEEIPILQPKPEPAEHCGVTQIITTRYSIDSPVVPTEATSKFRWLSLFVLVLLCFLIIVNVILLLKLWKLEERIEEDITIRARMPNLSALKQLPNNHEDWIELLRQQEILHETELKKWHTVLQTAIELLKKTERTLAELMFR